MKKKYFQTTKSVCDSLYRLFSSNLHRKCMLMVTSCIIEEFSLMLSDRWTLMYISICIECVCAAESESGHNYKLSAFPSRVQTVGRATAVCPVTHSLLKTQASFLSPSYNICPFPLWGPCLFILLFIPLYFQSQTHEREAHMHFDNCPLSSSIKTEEPSLKLTRSLTPVLNQRDQ